MQSIKFDTLRYSNTDDFGKVAENSFSECNNCSISGNQFVESDMNKAAFEVGKYSNGSEENDKMKFLGCLRLTKKSVFSRAPRNKFSKKEITNADINGNITDSVHRGKNATFPCRITKKLSLKKKYSKILNLNKKLAKIALKNLLKIDFEEIIPTFIIEPAKNSKADDSQNDNECGTMTLRENVSSSGLCSGGSEKSSTAVSMSSNVSFEKLNEEAEKSTTLLSATEIELNYNKLPEENGTFPTVNDSISKKYKFENDLMPWSRTLTRKNFKEENSYEIMRSKQSLMDLYKCMDSNCAYTSKFRLFFQSHVEDHQRQGSMMSFFNFCAYCNFNSSNPAILGLHIAKVHSFSKFQCSVCFFRTLAPETAHEHMTLHHQQTRGVILRCPGEKTRTDEEIHRRIFEMRTRFVKPIPCKCE